VYCTRTPARGDDDLFTELPLHHKYNHLLFMTLRDGADATKGSTEGDVYLV